MCVVCQQQQQQQGGALFLSLSPPPLYTLHSLHISFSFTLQISSHLTGTSSLHSNLRSSQSVSLMLRFAPKLFLNVALQLK